MTKYLTSITSLLLVLALTGVASGQSRQDSQQSGQVKKTQNYRLPDEKRFKFDWSDLALAGGMAADTATSIGGHEAGLFRGRDGKYAVGPNVAFKCGLFAAFKLLEWRYPEHRKATKILKCIAGAGFGIVAVHNSRVR